MSFYVKVRSNILLDKPQVYTDPNDFIISISDTLMSSHPIGNAAFFMEIKPWLPKLGKRRLRYDQHGPKLYWTQSEP